MVAFHPPDCQLMCFHIIIPFRRSTGSLHIANQDGRTPLMVAASKGRQDIARQLLAAGAFINLQVLLEQASDTVANKDLISCPPKDTASDTALILACRNGHSDMVDLLLQK